MIILCEDLNWQLSSSRVLALYLTPLQVVTVETLYIRDWRYSGSAHREHTMARTFTLIYLFEESLPIRAIFSVYRTRPAKLRGRVNDPCWQVLPTLQNIFLEAIQLSEP